MNKKFHRIMVDGETYYRELDCGEVVRLIIYAIYFTLIFLFTC